MCGISASIHQCVMSVQENTDLILECLLHQSYGINEIWGHPVLSKMSSASCRIELLKNMFCLLLFKSSRRALKLVLCISEQEECIMKYERMGFGVLKKLGIPE